MQVPRMHQMSLKYYVCVDKHYSTQSPCGFTTTDHFLKMHLNDAVTLDVSVNAVSSS